MTRGKGPLLGPGPASFNVPSPPHHTQNPTPHAGENALHAKHYGRLHSFLGAGDRSHSNPHRPTVVHAFPPSARHRSLFSRPPIQAPRRLQACRAPGRPHSQAGRKTPVPCRAPPSHARHVGEALQTPHPNQTHRVSQAARDGRGRNTSPGPRQTTAISTIPESNAASVPPKGPHGRAGSDAATPQ
jgi:hypothetical protein